MQQHLHIVAFDVPYPPDYGGVIDVFYKLKALHSVGFRIHLHCFQYGRKAAPELEEFCESVQYYPRSVKNIRYQFSLTPFTVLTRQSKDLETNLLKDNYPIVFEVLHTCYLLNDKRFRHRLKFYRHSNIEHDYYSHLARSEKRLFRKLYLYIEAFKLKRFEPIVEHATAILSVNENDARYFCQRYPKVRTEVIPSFHPYDKVVPLTTHDNYILYHGNLSISENYEAVLWLARNVFSRLPEYKVIVAGKKPPSFLVERLKEFRNIEVIPDPTATVMDHLITHALVNTLYTHQATGLKLKLLNVLFAGGFVIANEYMLSGSPFEGQLGKGGLYIANTADEFINQIKACFRLTYDPALHTERCKMIEKSRVSVITEAFIQLLADVQSSHG
ncbi:MAG: hypothetical protein QM534_00420 [Sediminibacterium sp.]|nr:hypothetical protein [Sediminibacterium sp.]